MFLNYLKVAFRNLRRRFSYSAINIAGLAVGLACTLIIGMWVHQETSNDRHFQDSERIYRVGANFYNIGDMAPGPPKFAEVMRTGFPQVERTTQIDWAQNPVMHVGGEEFRQPDAFRADSAFFEVFSHRFVAGNPSTALDDPNAVVLTDELARTYFGQEGTGYESVIGEQILVGEEEIPYTVAGVVEDRGYRSHIPARMWLSTRYPEEGSWTSASSYNYVKLREGVSEAAYREALDRLVEQEIYPALGGSLSYEEWKTSATGYRFLTMNIEDIYLQSDQRFEIGPTGDRTNVRAFGIVALFILLIAAINFINLVTARGATRAREVGIRKTLGTGRPALVMQFLMESVLLCLMAMVLALGLAEIFLSAFKSMTGLAFLDTVLQSPVQVLSMSGIAVLVGLLAGLYPAFYLTRFDPVSVLKGTYRSASSAPLRNALVISQFAISIGLIICAGVVYRQLDYMQQKDMGLETENVLVVDNLNDLGQGREALREEASRLAGVQVAGFSNRIPAGQGISIINMQTPQMEEPASIQRFLADAAFPSLMGFRLLEGRYFDSGNPSDTSTVVLNESAVSELGLTGEALGARINDRYEVIGVVSDFNYESLRKRIEPTVLMYHPGYRQGNRLLLKVESGQVETVLASMHELWNSRSPDEAMNYYFMDRNFEQMLGNEKILARIVALFTGLAILVSCMGLYGLSSYITEQRTKEIGIRRVLGADIKDIILRLNKSFTWPVAVAIAVAVPAAYLVMDRWLSNFAYQAGMSP
ncbi:MAG: ABC transporter permease [Balneolaceae bacterium]|nr:ABC transporter permease [Balneolaceae bacterium]